MSLIARASKTSGGRLAMLALGVGVLAIPIVVAARALRSTGPAPVIRASLVPHRNSQIAFLGGTRPGGVFGSSDVYVMNSDGSAVRRLTFESYADLEPAWSPDGRRIAFVRTGGEFPPVDILVMNEDGTGQTVLSHSDGQYQGTPTWSPDGRRIAFSRGGNNTDYDIYVMDANGKDVLPLTGGPGSEMLPAWSPDGTKIAFVSSRTFNSGPTDVWLIRADGTNRVRLPIKEEFPSSVAWSPDGRSLLVLESEVDQGRDLHLLAVDGSEDRALIVCRKLPGCTDINGASWSPDGSQIALSIHSQGIQDFYDGLLVMNADGTDLRKLSTGGIESCCPAWQPLTG